MKTYAVNIEVTFEVNSTYSDGAMNVKFYSKNDISAIADAFDWASHKSNVKIINSFSVFKYRIGTVRKKDHKVNTGFVAPEIFSWKRKDGDLENIKTIIDHEIAKRVKKIRQKELLDFLKTT